MTVTVEGGMPPVPAPNTPSTPRALLQGETAKGSEKRQTRTRQQQAKAQGYGQKDAARRERGQETGAEEFGPCLMVHSFVTAQRLWQPFG